ncbi:unnamed protein product, partial [Phaeothamnion confervicola]
GFGGDDTLTGGTGDDWLSGGEGRDTLFGGGSVSGGGHDELFGEGGSDELFAGAGFDLLDGGDGVDLLTAGFGTSGTFVGGAGEDIFVFESQASGLLASTITIADFTSGMDTIIIRTNLPHSEVPEFDAGPDPFVSGFHPGLYLLYDTDNGELSLGYHDSDPTLDIQPHVVTTLAGAPTLLYSDISFF